MNSVTPQREHEVVASCPPRPGASTELGAYVRLRAAGDQVAAREAWLHWIDDESYRGLNAEPFELLPESFVA